MVNLRRDLYPFVGSVFKVDGFALHYLDEGQGEPVVMLHGNPTWSFYFRNLLTALRGRYRAVAPDHMGCGFSERPDGRNYPYTLSRRVDDLEALLEHLGIKKNITLVMHDWGGMIGMAYASRHPEAVSRLVLLNTAAFHLPKTKPFPLALRLCRHPMLGDLLVRRTGLFCHMAWRVCSVKPLSPQVRDAYWEPYRTADRRLGLREFVQDIPLQPGDRSYELVSEVEAGLGRFKSTPTLIIWGEKDFVFDLHFLQAWREHLPSAEVHSFPNAGHLVLEDVGTEALALIESFLARNPLAG